MSLSSRQKVPRSNLKPTTLYKRLDISGHHHSNSELKQPGNHVLSHKYRNLQAIGFPPKHHPALEEKTERKVTFRRNSTDKHQRHSNKMKLIINKKPSSGMAQQKQVVSVKSIKSADSSFFDDLKENDLIKSHRSATFRNPKLSECRKIACEILKKLQIFDDSSFDQKQLTGWIETYLQESRPVLASIFLKPRTKKHPRRQELSDPQLERNLDVVYSRVATKHKDRFLGSERFVKVGELTLYSQFLERLYTQKTKIKMKEIEATLTVKMTQMCRQIREEQNGDYICALRKKPTEISCFMQDLRNCESQLGSLKKIAVINLNRFNILNDTDMVVDNQIMALNEEVRKSASAMQIEWLQ